tara:strand:+ start:50 stop:883 length:834 start_codon:yes stop_codon:yes gene_type:complete
MSYLLCLGFTSFKYKKDPIIKLYIDDKFLYEFEINSFYTAKQFSSKKEIDHKLARQVKTKFLHLYNKDYTHYLRTIDPLKNFNNYNKMVKYDQDVFAPDINWHFFELDNDLVLNAKKLQIDINAEDSNYTNGFMTLSTIYSLKVANIIPKKVVDDYKKIFKKYDIDLKQYNRKQNTIKTIKKFYAKNNNIPTNKNYFNLLDQQITSTYTLDGEKVQHDTGENYSCIWYGGNKRIMCNMNKNRLILDNNCIKNDLLAYDLAYAICNKYKQHENQRSNI